MIVLHIASEYLHGADTKAQRKEGLIHRIDDHLADTACWLNGVQIGNEIKRQPFLCTGKQTAVDRQHKDDGKKRQHHIFFYALNPLLQTEQTRRDSDHDTDRRKDHH